MTRIIVEIYEAVVIYEAEIYKDGRMFSVPPNVKKSLGDDLDFVIRTKAGQFLLAVRLRTQSGPELYVTCDQLEKSGLKPKDSIIVEASKPGN